MDAFYAAVETRDNPELAGKPLIIGAMPHERGVVATCSYEARAFGVRSAMSIKEAYRLCPSGTYMHPNFRKYGEASSRIHGICETYTDLTEYISLDEGFLDVTRSAHLFGGARNVGLEIKRRVLEETGLTCSVGIGYSLMSAKLASEEKKPDGFYEIPTPEDLKGLICDRSVRVVYGIGPHTAEALYKVGVRFVRDILECKSAVRELLGKHGAQIIELAEGIDNREVARIPKSQSVGKEYTFQRDIADREYLDDVLRLIARELSFGIKQNKVFCRTITLKATYADMKKITRSITGDATNASHDIYRAASDMLGRIEKRPVRLVGISLSGLTDSEDAQISMFEADSGKNAAKAAESAMAGLQSRYGVGIVKTGSELRAELRLASDESDLNEEFNKRY